MKLPELFSAAVLLGAVCASPAVTPQASAQTARGPRTTTLQPGAPTAVPVTRDTPTTTTATTVPVGFTTVTVAPAASSSAASSQVLSVPFYTSAAYAAPVSSVNSSTQFTSTAASWTANQFAQAATPYLVHVKSGNSVGRYFLIQSNTTNQVVVYSRGYDLTTIITAGDLFEIVPANTLGTLFGTSSVPFQTGDSATTADNIFLWNGTNFDQYYHDGTAWKRSDSLLSQNNTVLYPDEGIFLTRRSTAALSLTFLGTVPSTTERSDVPGPGSTFVSNRFPVNTTLSAVGFQLLPFWKSGSSVSDADSVYLWNGTNWAQYYYDGTNWRRSDSLLTFDSQAITAATAMFVVRQSAATGSSSTLTQTLPYSL